MKLLRVTIALPFALLGSLFLLIWIWLDPDGSERVITGAVEKAFGERKGGAK